MDQKVVFVDLTAPCPLLSTVRGAPDCGEAGADYPPPFPRSEPGLSNIDFPIVRKQVAQRVEGLMSGRILGVFDLDLISRHENPQKTVKTNTKNDHFEVISIFLSYLLGFFAS